MANYTRAEKFKANRGVQGYIVELLQTSPDGPKTRGQLFTEILPVYPLADIKTVGNALSILKKKGMITRLPSTKSRRGYRWEIKGGQAVDAYLPPESKIKYVGPQDVLDPLGVGVAIITALVNMKKRISEQDDKLAHYQTTLRNRDDVWKRKEDELRTKIVDQEKIILSLQAQLEPDPDLMFKLADIASFSVEKEG